MKNDVNTGKFESPDVIMILAGTNDCLQNKPLGDINSTFSTTSLGSDVTKLTNLAQSVRFTIEEIQNSFPNAKIILCTPLAPGNANSYTQMLKVRDILIQCANILNLDIIDQTFKSGVVWYKEAQKNKYYQGDRIHLNSLGGKLVANFIYRELLSLPYFYQETLKSVTLNFINSDNDNNDNSNDNNNKPETNYFRDKLLGTTRVGVWENAVMIPDQIIPSGSRLISFKCNAHSAGTAYLSAFIRGESTFTPVYVKKISFIPGENTFDLDYTATSDIYFGWKTERRGFLGMDLSTIGKDVMSINGQHYHQYWGIHGSTIIPVVDTPLSNCFVESGNDGITFDCMLITK